MSNTLKPPIETARVSRRRLLAGTAGTMVIATSACSTPIPTSMPSASAFNTDERATLRAWVDRLVPADDYSPAASDCGVLDYLDHSLAEWNQADLPLLRDAIAVLDAQARAQESTAFASLPAEAQDALLMRMEAGQFPSGAGQAGFNRLLRLTLEGMFSDPYYGGNRNYAGWDLIGYPGAVLASTQDMQAMGARLPPLHTSAYGAAHDGH